MDTEPEVGFRHRHVRAPKRGRDAARNGHAHDDGSAQLQVLRAPPIVHGTPVDVHRRQGADPVAVDPGAPGGTTLGGILTVTCHLPGVKVPEEGEEGIRLNVRDVINFNGSNTLFVEH